MKFVKISEKTHPKIGIAVLVEKEKQFLIGLRKGAHGAGTWGLPGGHLEFGESVETCAKRELLEETGLRALECSMGPWVENVMEGGTKHYITIVVKVVAFTGNLQLLEPEKCEKWQWFPLDLFPEPLFDALDSLTKLHRNWICSLSNAPVF
ncbi:MAG: NUDIX domain-containing protein [Chlamydiae bacterium]|nr:NUDIX domain-containing protein [Chlamydiota bacterium]